jgi:uncharacterized protein YqjF (DUF2071 family)
MIGEVMSRPFLTARWTNLCLFTYSVPPEILAKRLPAGLELDRRGDEAFVSLVAFDFQDTRVWGIPWPGYRNFAELNLRYYVRRPGERGVVFIREIVPQRWTAWLARKLYNEPYATAPLVSRIAVDETWIAAERSLLWNGHTYRIAVTAQKPALVPPDDSIEHFFKEHHWGYGVSKKGQTIRYRVEHPVWEIYPVTSHRLDFDFADVYGAEWEFLTQAKPYSVVFAAGSAISVAPKDRTVIA